MQRPLTKFEKKIQGHLKTVPLRKYDLWELTECGQIAGYYYVSIEYSFKTGDEIGWYYVIENDGTHEMIHESQVVVKEADHGA